MGFLRGSLRMRGKHLPNICHTYREKMKFGSYSLPEEDPRKYGSRDFAVTFLNQKILLYEKMQI